MQVGRDETVRVALFAAIEPAIISPAYLVFEVIDNDVLLSEFLMMWFRRPESDRCGWFISDSSVRSSLEWERFCDIKIPLPDIEVQRKHVALYKALQKNQQVYEKSLDDLQLICDSFLDGLHHSVSKKRIGDFIVLIDNRNSSLRVTDLRGINVLKELMPSKARVDKASLVRYKVVENKQFAYSAMQVGRDETIRVALHSEERPIIVSPAYSTFYVDEKLGLLSEFFMAWLKRSELNRYGWFLSDSSVRASLEWDRFCDIKMPIPDIETQKSIVAIHHVLETRKRLSNELKAQIRNLCPILMRGVVEEMA